jgi:hypothetical protein
VSGWSLFDLLPGLLFLALSLGLAAALRRWYDPLPPRVLALFLLLVSVLFASSLFGGRILLPLGGLTRAAPFINLPPPPPGNGLQGDLLHQIVPWELEVRRAVFDGRWPLWNAHAGAGMPLLGDPQSQAFQPLVAAAWLLPVCNAAAVTSALRVFFALAFLFLFLRRQTLGEPAALCGALAYGLGGFLLLWLGWPIGNAAALLPGLLYAVAALTPVPSPARATAPRPERERGAATQLQGRTRTGTDEHGHIARGRAGGSPLPFGVGVWGPHGGGAGGGGLLFLLTAAILLGGHPETVLYALACAGLFLCARTLAHPGWRERRALLLRAGSAMALAGLAAAPVLLTASGYLPQTHRSTVIGVHLTQRPLPELAAELERPEVLEGWAEDALRRLLPMAAPRAFGDLASGYWGSANIVEDTGGFAGAAALLAALLALIPLRGGEKRFPQERFAVVLLLACLALIAQPPGFDNLFFRLPVIGATAVHRHHRTLLLVNLAVAWLAACGIERWQRGAVRRVAVLATAALLAGLITWAYLAHPSPENGHIVTGLLSGGLAAQLLAIGLAAGLLLARPGTRWSSQAPMALAVLIAAELFLLHHDVNSVAPAAFAYPPEPSLAFLQKSLGAYRMVALGDSLPTNVPAVYGLRDVRIDNPSLPTAYSRLVEILDRNPLAPRFGRPLHPLYDLLAVRYVLVRAGVPVRLPLVYQDPAVWIYQRPQALPLLFLPARARMQRGEPWLPWVQGNTDFAARALAAPSAERWQPWRSPPGDRSTVTLTAYGSALLRAHASFATPRLLASSVYQDGNWHLLDGGVRVSTTSANGPFLAAWLPAGEHDLRFLYRPRRFVAGCLLAALALAAACALWVPVPVKVSREAKTAFARSVTQQASSVIASTS